METHGDVSRFLAYPYQYIEPSGENAKRNDGEKLLQRLRSFWNVCDASMPNWILGSLAAKQENVSIVSTSLMDPSSPLKPKCRLVAPTTQSVHHSDLEPLSEQQRESLVAIRGSGNLAVRKVSRQDLPKPIILIRFEKDQFKSKMDGLTQDAIVELVMESETCVNVSLVSFAGSRKCMSVESNEKETFLDLFDANYIQAVREVHLLPKHPNQLPFGIQLRVAEFWNREMRASSLVAASNPLVDAALVGSAACFTSVCITRAGKDAVNERAVLSATLHESSSSCLCTAHGLRPVEKRFPEETFTGSSVTMTISMCGRPVDKFAPNDPHGICPLHGNQTPRIQSIPGLCCYDTRLEVSCQHFTRERECKRGVCLRSITPDPANLLHAQTLVAASIRSMETVAPMIGKRRRCDIALECNRQCDRLDIGLESVKRKRESRSKQYTDQELDAMDQTTADLLKKGKTFQRYVKTKRQTVLIKPNSKTGGVSFLGKEYEKLFEYHKWMFPHEETVS